MGRIQSDDLNLECNNVRTKSKYITMCDNVSVTADGGIKIYRHGLPPAILKWNEATKKWSCGIDGEEVEIGDSDWSSISNTPTTLSGYGITDAKDIYGNTPFNTSNTESTNYNKWTKVLTTTITGQYGSTNLRILFIAGNDGSATFKKAMLDFRIKQQSVFGNNPLYDIDLIECTGITSNDFVAVIVQNTPSTIVDLYIRIPDTWQVYKFIPLISYKTYSTVTFLSNQGFITNLPAGTQIVSSNATAGDMVKSVYDTDADGKVNSAVNADNADTVNGLTVQTAVPTGAVFTDTVYTHPSTHPYSMISDTPTSLPANGGNADTLDSIDSKGFGRAYSSAHTFGTGVAMTTAEFITMLTNLGAFAQPYWIARGSWSYAGNNYISDTGLGHIHLAGATVEVIGSATTDGYTIRIHTATTSDKAGVIVSSDYIYLNNGSTYSPGWRKLWNSSNDGHGSGLVADKLDDKEASDFFANGSPTVGVDPNAAPDGVSYISNNANCPNFFPEDHSGTLYQKTYSVNWITQFAVAFHSADIAVRAKINGTWSAWSRAVTMPQNTFSIQYNATDDSLDFIYG